jgi:hypothetical protein
MCADLSKHLLAFANRAHVQLPMGIHIMEQPGLAHHSISIGKYACTCD